MDQLNITDNVDTLFHSLENFTQKEGVIGKAVTQGDKTLFPVVSVTVGYGGGNASMKAPAGGASSSSYSSSSSSGTGALGLGAKLNTEAIIIIDSGNNQNVSLLPMSTSGASQIVEKIPQILQGMNQGKGQSGSSSGSAATAGTSGQQ
jgi:uncharacterized spore protein YtfJ